MLTKITIHLRSHDPLIPCDQKSDSAILCPSVHWGTLLHGALMSFLPPALAIEYHDGKTHSYSQYVQPMNARDAIWHIGVMGDAGEEFYVSLRDVRSITLNKKGTVLADGFQRTVRTRERFFMQFQSGVKLKRQFRLEIRTPCSHHSEGHYLVFPSMELIFQTLLKRAAGWFQGNELFKSEEIAKQLASVTQITRYELRTEPFYHNQSLIIGYQGFFEVKLSGTEEETRLIGMLLMLAEYLGIGIKTAYGMGGVTVSL